MSTPVIGQVIFDLDGTLINSLPDLQHALNRMLAGFDKPPLALEQVRKLVGDGAGVLVNRALSLCGLPDTEHSQALRAFLAFYSEDPVKHTQLYPGAVETLEGLMARGHELSICTNKPLEPTQHILQTLHLKQYFKQVIGGDSFSFRKPDPRMLRAILEPTNTAPDRAVMVGDSEVDSATALSAQVPFVLMSYGYHRTPIAELKSHAVLHDLRRLLQVLV